MIDHDQTGGVSSVDAAVRRLTAAARDYVACAPVRDLIGPDDVTTAYAVQGLINRARVSAGATVVGRKIGLTAPAVQAQLGVDRPDFGVLFDDMDRSGAAGAIGEAPLNQLMQPKLEAEIAFVLGMDLAEGPLDDAHLRSAVAEARPALEIVDSRIAGWDITIADTIADNGSSGLFVLGEDAVELERFEPAAARMELRRGNDVVSRGSGQACLGDPLNALAWLAKTAVALGDPLLAGHVVLSGALGPMVAVTEAGHYTADITGLGSASIKFTAEDAR